MLAAGSGHADAVRALLEKGADPAARDKTGRTAFDWAMSSPHAESIYWAVGKALLRARE